MARVPISLAAICLILSAATADAAQWISMAAAKRSARHLAAKIVREGDGEGYSLRSCNRIDGGHVNCRVHDWGYGDDGSISCDYSILVTPTKSRARHSRCS